MTSNYGTECPACGSARTLVKTASLDERGHRIRIRHCEVCPEQFTTVEFAVPFNYWSAETLRRDAQPRNHRRAPDSFIVQRNRGGWSFRLEEGVESNMCKRNLHELEGDNVYTHPSGQRVCKPCRRENDQQRYANRIAKMPAALRDELREQRRIDSARRVEYRKEWARRRRAA